MDIATRLLLFLDVVEKGSFSKAALSRDVDRSVISKQITRLESELGVRLLNRTTRSFSLTAAGAEMIKKAKELRELLSETTRLAETFDTEAKGLLRIASSTAIGRNYVQPVINEFQKKHPQVEIELLLEDRLVDIIAEGYDLAFRVTEPKDSSLIARKIARNRLLLLASPDFIKKYGEPTSVSELEKLPASTYTSESLKIKTFNYIDSQGKERQATINSIFRTNDGDTLIQKVISGDTYMICPAFLIKDEVQNNQLKPLLKSLHLPEHAPLYALYPHRALPTRTQLFLAAFCDYIGHDLPIWENRIPEFSSLYGYSP